MWSDSDDEFERASAAKTAQILTELEDELFAAPKICDGTRIVQDKTLTAAQEWAIQRAACYSSEITRARTDEWTSHFLHLRTVGQRAIVHSSNEAAHGHSGEECAAEEMLACHGIDEVDERSRIRESVLRSLTEHLLSVAIRNQSKR